jgi:hypothetical protein
MVPQQANNAPKICSGAHRKSTIHRNYLGLPADVRRTSG